METKNVQLTVETIDGLRKKYPRNALYQLDLPDGKQFVVRGSSYDEFSRVVKTSKGNEARMGLQIVSTFVVFPDIDATDLEYNNSGNWEPGLIAALSEQIQETLGYSKDITVKKL